VTRDATAEVNAMRANGAAARGLGVSIFAATPRSSERATRTACTSYTGLGRATTSRSLRPTQPGPAIASAFGLDPGASMAPRRSCSPAASSTLAAEIVSDTKSLCRSSTLLALRFRPLLFFLLYSPRFVLLFLVYASTLSLLSLFSSPWPSCLLPFSGVLAVAGRQNCSGSTHSLATRVGFRGDRFSRGRLACWRDARWRRRGRGEDGAAGHGPGGDELGCNNHNGGLMISWWVDPLPRSC